MDRTTWLFPTILLGILALITVWIDKAVQAPLKKIDGSQRHDADYYLNNFVSTKTDINGDLRYKLAAAKMTHYPDNDTTELARPRFTRYTQDKPYSQIEAQRGFLSKNGEIIEMVEHVKVIRQAFAGRGEMMLSTEKLSIDTKNETAKTDLAVVITQAPKTVIHATGMVFDKKKNTIILLHKVRAHYENPVIAGYSKLPQANQTASGLTLAQKINLPADIISPKVRPSLDKAPNIKLNLSKEVQ